MGHTYPPIGRDIRLSRLLKSQSSRHQIKFLLRHIVTNAERASERGGNRKGYGYAGTMKDCVRGALRTRDCISDMSYIVNFSSTSVFACAFHINHQGEQKTKEGRERERALKPTFSHRPHDGGGRIQRQKRSDKRQWQPAADVPERGASAS